MKSRIYSFTVIYFFLIAIAASVFLSCSNPLSSSDSLTGPHSWYYTISTSDGTSPFVSSCVNSSGGDDSPGTVASPWTSPTYSMTLSVPMAIGVTAVLPSSAAASTTITARLYADGKFVSSQTSSGPGAGAALSAQL